MALGLVDMIRLDTILHFSVSLLLTWLVFYLLFPSKRKRSELPINDDFSGTWKSRKVVIGVILGISVVVVIGVWKEWRDSWGFGNVQFSDVLANLAGIAAGFKLSRLQAKEKQSQGKIEVKLRSNTSDQEKPSAGPVRLRSSVSQPRKSGKDRGSFQ